MNGQAPAKSVGDDFFFAVDQRDARTLPAGVLADGLNLRFTDGRAEPRKGLVKPAWANRTTAGSDRISPYGQPYGAGVFKDPNSVEWQFIAADGYAWRTRPYNQTVSIPLPTGVRLLGPVTFCQAFNRMFCFRGPYLAPLKLSDVDDGFEDIVQHWNASDTFAAAVEVAYGPYQAVTSITRAGSTATVITTLAHGYITGADITHVGAGQAEYNVRANITVVDEFTYTFQVAGSPATPATGTITASNSIRYWRSLGSLRTLTSLTRSTTTATATKIAHGFTAGQTVTIAGVTPSGYNGTYVIAVPTPDTFTYTMALDPGGSGSGTMTARNSLVIAGESPDTNPEAWARVYNILPNATHARYKDNLMLVPTSYEPASVDDYANFTGGEYRGKVDFLALMDYQDETHFQFFNEFRINQGSADEIVDLVKFSEGTWIVWKGKGWAELSGVTGDFSTLKLDFREEGYGLAARGAWGTNGRVISFLSPDRRIVSIEQSEQGKLLGVDVPLSAPIERTMNRLNGPLLTGARMVVFKNRLYCAVPKDDATLLTRAPDAPAIALLTTGDGIFVTWSAIDTATSYNVYQVIAGNYILFTTTTGFSWGPADPGNVTYVVTAVNAVGASSYSNEVTTTP